MNKKFLTVALFLVIMVGGAFGTVDFSEDFDNYDIGTVEPGSWTDLEGGDLMEVSSEADWITYGDASEISTQNYEPDEWRLNPEQTQTSGLIEWDGTLNSQDARVTGVFQPVNSGGDADTYTVSMWGDKGNDIVGGSLRVIFNHYNDEIIVRDNNGNVIATHSEAEAGLNFNSSNSFVVEKEGNNLQVILNGDTKIDTTVSDSEINYGKQAVKINARSGGIATEHNVIKPRVDTPNVDKFYEFDMYQQGDENLQYSPFSHQAEYNIPSGATDSDVYSFRYWETDYSDGGGIEFTSRVANRDDNVIIRVGTNNPQLTWSDGTGTLNQEGVNTAFNNPSSDYESWRKITIVMDDDNNEYDLIWTDANGETFVSEDNSYIVEYSGSVEINNLRVVNGGGAGMQDPTNWETGGQSTMDMRFDDVQSSSYEFPTLNSPSDGQTFRDVNTVDLNYDYSAHLDGQVEVQVSENGGSYSTVETIQVTPETDVSNAITTINVNEGSDYDWRVQYHTDETNETYTSGTNSFNVAIDNPPIIDEQVWYLEDSQGNTELIQDGDTVYVSDITNYDLLGEANVSDDYALSNYDWTLSDGQVTYDVANGSISGTSDLATAFEDFPGDYDTNYTAELTVEDDTGQTTTNTISFDIVEDVTPPSFDLEYSVSGNDVTVTPVNASEQIDRVELELPSTGETATVQMGESYTFTNVPDGAYNPEATAYDRAGNSATETTENIYIDTTPPTIDSLTAQQIVGDGPTVEISYSFSDNRQLDRAEFYVNGNLVETENYNNASVSGTLEVSQYLQDGNNDFTVELYDINGFTSSQTTTIDVAVEGPEIDDYSVTITGSDDTRAEWNDNFDITIQGSEIESASFYLTAGGENLTEEENITVGETTTVDPQDYFSKQYLESLSGEISVTFIVEDQYGNEATYSDLTTPLTFIQDIDFRNWWTTSPIGETELEMRFDSTDDLVEIDTFIYRSDSDGQVNLSFSPEPQDCGWFDTCSQYIDTLNNDYNVTVENQLNENQTVYHRGQPVGTLEPYETRTFSEEEFNLQTSSKLGVGSVEGDTESLINYGELSREDWSTQEEITLNGEEVTRYTASTDVGLAGVYQVELHLEDSAGNTKVVEREGRVRPDTATGNFYQMVVNYGISDYHVGLLILAIPIGIVFWFEYKMSQGFTFIMTSLFTLVYGSGLLVYSLLPPSASTVALYSVGLIFAVLVWKVIA